MLVRWHILSILLEREFLNTNPTRQRVSIRAAKNWLARRTLIVKRQSV